MGTGRPVALGKPAGPAWLSSMVTAASAQGFQPVSDELAGSGGGTARVLCGPLRGRASRLHLHPVQQPCLGLPWGRTARTRTLPECVVGLGSRPHLAEGVRRCARRIPGVGGALPGLAPADSLFWGTEQTEEFAVSIASGAGCLRLVTAPSWESGCRGVGLRDTTPRRLPEANHKTTNP